MKKNVRVRLVRQYTIDVIVTGFDNLQDAIDHVWEESQIFLIFSGDASFEPEDQGIVDIGAKWTDNDEIQD